MAASQKTAQGKAQLPILSEDDAGQAGEGRLEIGLRTGAHVGVEAGIAGVSHGVRRVKRFVYRLWL
ncbi:hypothetical protein [Hydrocarboniphaga effusa]|uniref:hypothetical protein n=1 Tax=Hydrocarboniphaga effusa TaxID=243629 RepID=UPI0035B4C7C1